jgi:hypothetical protein
LEQLLPPEIHVQVLSIREPANAGESTAATARTLAAAAAEEPAASPATREP